MSKACHRRMTVWCRYLIGDSSGAAAWSALHYMAPPGSSVLNRRAYDPALGDLTVSRRATCSAQLFPPDDAQRCGLAVIECSRRDSVIRVVLPGAHSPPAVVTPRMQQCAMSREVVEKLGSLLVVDELRCSLDQQRMASREHGLRPWVPGGAQHLVARQVHEHRLFDAAEGVGLQVRQVPATWATA